MQLGSSAFKRFYERVKHSCTKAQPQIYLRVALSGSLPSSDVTVSRAIHHLGKPIATPFKIAEFI